MKEVRRMLNTGVRPSKYLGVHLAGKYAFSSIQHRVLITTLAKLIAYR